jgi:large subunit ribosomal protein L13
MKPKSFRMRPADIQRRWYHLDADSQILGKIAVRTANLLMGKVKPTFTPGVDTGDFVVVTNADKVVLTGAKSENKRHQWFTGYFSGQREELYSHILGRKPEKVVQLAVRRMLPKNRLGRRMFSRLKVYAGVAHPHEAQAPETIKVR